METPRNGNTPLDITPVPRRIGEKHLTYALRTTPNLQTVYKTPTTGTPTKSVNTSNNPKITPIVSKMTETASNILNKNIQMVTWEGQQLNKYKYPEKNRLHS